MRLGQLTSVTQGVHTGALEKWSGSTAVGNKVTKSARAHSYELLSSESLVTPSTE